jgi:hypothetical protein
LAEKSDAGNQFAIKSIFPTGFVALVPFFDGVVVVAVLTGDI